MARSAKHSPRRKGNFKDEPIDVTELAGMSNVEGMLSFLEKKPEEYARLFKNAESSGAPVVAAPSIESDADAPILRAPEQPAPDPGAVPESHPELEVANAGTPEVDAPTFDAPDLDDVYLYRAPRPAPQLATTVQAGHTHGEQALYTTLWRLARPHPNAAFRAIRIGERTLAREVPMAYSTVQENARALEKKLAIEIRSNGPREPKTYIVHAADEVLRRRRAAGLTHVYRRTSGVFLTSGALNSGAPDLG